MRFRPSWFDTDFARLKVNSCPFEPQDFIWSEAHKPTKNGQLRTSNLLCVRARLSSVLNSSSFKTAGLARLIRGFSMVKSGLSRRRSNFESVAEQIGKGRPMIDKVLGRILGEVRLKFLLCHRVDRLGPIPGSHPPLQPASKIVRMIIRSLLFGREKAIKSLLDAQNLSGSFDMVRHELDAPRQRPAHRQKIDRLDGVAAMLLVHTGTSLPE
jgi:hypothetical protein